MCAYRITLNCLEKVIFPTHCLEKVKEAKINYGYFSIDVNTSGIRFIAGNMCTLNAACWAFTGWGSNSSKISVAKIVLLLTHMTKFESLIVLLIWFRTFSCLGFGYCHLNNSYVLLFKRICFLQCDCRSFKGG